MKKILLATDLETNSDRAIERALQIAAQQNAELHILHVIPHYKKSSIPKMFKKQAQDLIENILSEEFSEYKNLKIKTEVLISKEPYAEILQYADKIKTDLIVMGLHGKTKFRDLFVGTTVERVIRIGRKPVLMVKNKALSPYENVMAAIDLGPASRNALRMAMNLYPRANFDMIHTYPVPHTGALSHTYAIQIYENYEESHRKSMEAFKKTEENFYNKRFDKKIRLNMHIVQGDPLKEILKLSKQKKPDLLTIGAHGKSILSPSKLGGVAEDILANPPCDVLIIKE